MRVLALKYMTRMLRPLCFAVGMLALTMAPGVSFAQQAQQITFDDAIRIALDNNYSLKRAANFVRLQETTVRSQRAAFLPSFNMSTSSGRNFGLNFDQTTGNTFNQTSDRLNFSASSGITLFNGFRDFASLKQARLSLVSTDLTHERQRQTVVFSVMSQFLTLIQQREAILIQEENLEAQRQLLTQIEEFVRVGSRPVSDLYQQRAAAANAELSLLNVQRLFQLAEVGLIQTLQLDPFGDYDFVIPDVDDALLTPEQYEINALLRNAFDRRLDLRAQESFINASVEGIRVARSTMMPTLNLSGGAGTGYSSLQYRQGAQVPLGTQIKNNRSQSLSLSVQVPIFNGLRTKSQIQRARIDYANARLDLDNLRQDIGLQVRQAHLDYVTDEKSLDVTEKQLIAAEQALEAEQERYNVGASTLVELTQARANFVQASSDRAQAKYNFLFRKRLIEYYVGVLDPGRPLFE